MIGVLIAEIRSAVRLVRTWLFGCLSVGVTLAVFGFLAYAHGMRSDHRPIAGLFGPRFLIAEIGTYLLWVQLCGVLFLIFDGRARDIRDGMVEVLDSRPLSNLALLGGRLTGVVVATWLPVLLAAGLIQVAGLLGRHYWWMGDPVEPVSLAAFVLIDVLPALVLWGAVVTLLNSLLRNRAAVVVVALGLLGVQMWAVWNVPVYLLPVISLAAAHGGWASDLAPRFADDATLANRAIVLAVALGCLLLAAARSPRRDIGSSRRQLVFGSALIGVATLALGAMALALVDRMALRDDWLAAHHAARDVERRRPDTEQVTARVNIVPGDVLEVDAELRLRMPDVDDIPVVDLSFNPGMHVDSLEVDGEPAAYRHEAGLLKVDVAGRVETGAPLTVSITARGVPDPDFAYLDSAVDWRRRTVANRIRLLGTEASVFHPDYVALMPGVHWLPAVGANVGRDDPAIVSPDFYELDLVVDVPDGWLVAGPGRRQAVHGASTRFRFRPAAPVRNAGLFASRFHRLATRAGEIELELLVSPEHRRNLHFFAEGGVAIERWLAELFADAEALGIAYPFEGLSMVEVPSRLRTYGGGWRMPLLPTLPGLLPLKEHSLPTARFERWQPPFEPSRPGRDDGEHMWLELQVFFLNDNTGGNPVDALARNLTGTTGASGDGAMALDYVHATLASKLLAWTAMWGSGSSAHGFDANDPVGAPVRELLRGRGQLGWNVVERVSPAIDFTTENREAPLVRLNPGNDARGVAALLDGKGTAVAHLILDALGRQSAGAYLAEIRRRFEGRSFRIGDIEMPPGMPPIRDWLYTESAPGFLASPATVRRLEDDATGNPRYQVRVHVRNGEPVHGWTRLSTNPIHGRVASDPVRVGRLSAVEVGIVTTEPPAALWLQGYFYLNRRPIRLVLDTAVDDVSRESPFVGVRPSSWAPAREIGVVVDDQDTGFDVVTTASPGWSLFWAPNVWSKYFPSAVRMPAGDGSHAAVFSSVLPHPGPWRLDYHMPEAESNDTLGAYAMLLRTSQGEIALSFAADEAKPGWNEIGVFDLVAGEVALTVSDRSDADVVIADAIRWYPLGPVEQ